MEDPLYFSVAVLSVSTASILDRMVEKLYCDLKKLLNNNKRYRLIALRKRNISNPTDALRFLEAWKNESLIIYIGHSFQLFKSIFSEVEEVRIKHEGPVLAELLFYNQNQPFKSYFFNHTALVYKNSYFGKDHKESDEIDLPLLLSALLEAKKLGISKDVQYMNGGCHFLHKSAVSFIDPANRPRTSPFPMVSVKDALDKILEETSTLNTEIKELNESYSYVLSEDVFAPEPYPPFNASVKDGYAVIASDPTFDGPLPAVLSVIGNTEMGNVPKFKVEFGNCARVSTGGVIPETADAVVQVEDTQIENSHEGKEISIAFLKKPSKLQDIRVQGADVSKGSIVVPARQKIGSAEIGILSIFGISNVSSYKKPSIALLSTGDEVIEPDNPVTPGCIRDSNKRTLSHMLAESHIPFVDVGIAKDDPDVVKSHLLLAMNASDIIISTGGVSMGEKDIMKEVLRKDFGATIHFGRVHMKPGKPTTFSTVTFKGEKKFIFSLPGNPVSACVCFYLFVLPCIRKMIGYSHPEHKQIKVELEEDFKLDERPEFCRVSLKCGLTGRFIAQTTGDQQSSRLLSMQNADALLVLPPRTKELSSIKAGMLVDAILLRPL